MRPGQRFSVALLLVGGALLCGPAFAASRAVRVTAGGGHTCALTTDGGVKCWGWNGHGQLGDGTTNGRTSPVDVSGLSSGVASVSAGGSHTCAVTHATGGLTCWGENWSGELGDGTTEPRSTPTDVAGLTRDVVGVSLGDYHSCAVTAAGGVKCWGYNSSGQLGDGTTVARLVPTDVSGLASGVTAVAAGSYHTCALTTAGGVKCWGFNFAGQVGDGTTTDRSTPTDVVGLTSGVLAVAAGGYHTCALKADDSVVCWGQNSQGQLGDGTQTWRTAPTSVVGLAGGVVSVTPGRNHTCAVTEEAGLECWGSNYYGKIGDGTEESRAIPTGVTGLARGVIAAAAGGEHTCAVTRGGGVRCWGFNDHGQVGDGSRTTVSAPVGVMGLAAGVAAVNAGSVHTCALTTGGGLRCWGRNSSAQLGDGTTTMRTAPTDVAGSASGTAAVASGAAHSCALSTAGGLKCWGGNYYGELGDGTTTMRTAPSAVVGLSSGVASVAARDYHTCALTVTGGVKCWGDNGYGQLGDGTTADRAAPTDVVGLTTGVTAVAAGYEHTCALTSGGVKCWGNNAHGQLGDGTTTNRPTPTSVSGLTSGVVAVAAGYRHTCALTTGGGLKCWGLNDNGQLGDGTTADRGTPADVPGLTSGIAAVSAGVRHTCALTSGGGLKCWGQNMYGQLGDGTETERGTPADVTGLTSGVVSMSAGGSHTCAVTASGGAMCWGDNSDGKLGDPAWGPRQSPVRTRGFGQTDFDGDDVTDVAVYRPSTGTWFSLSSSTGNSSYAQHGWGLQAQGDAPAPGDYDGDGIVDPTVYRPQYGTWFILESHAGFTAWRWFGWGNATDTPMPGDYDGDGTSDVAVYRPSLGRWFVLPSSTDFAAGWAPITFGDPAKADLPVAGDFDGDGKRDPAVYRPSTGTWFWLKSSTSYTQYDWKGWGVQAHNDTPVPGDYDGDGKTDPCVFRPATGTWFILESRTGHTTWSWVGWGQPGDAPVPGDYDGDGWADTVVYRPATGEWFVHPLGRTPEWHVVFGQSGDLPLVIK